MKKLLRVGTRGSLLARAQTSMILKEIESKCDVSFEVITIKTQGDKVTNKPMWQLEGKDFFTKELDIALQEKKVDIVVHSYKDLSSVRPTGVAIGAITKRTFPNDILLFKKDFLNNIPKTIRIGTSSPRRMANLNILSEVFTSFSNSKVELEGISLRGNINGRIQKLLQGEFDCILLALAGLERIALSDLSSIEAKTLLSPLSFFIMPLSLYPAAPAQGALCVNCREDDQFAKDVLSTIHDKTTAEEVELEREYFRKYGGGCYLAMGITAKKYPQGMAIWQKGIYQGSALSEFEFIENEKKNPPKDVKNIFIGLPSKEFHTNDTIAYDELITKVQIAKKVPEKSTLYISTKHCLPLEISDCIVFAGGHSTAKSLWENKIFVHALSGFGGVKDLTSLFSSKALSLMGLDSKFYYLTHDENEKESSTLACYERKQVPLSPEFKEKIQNTTHFYWTSFRQFQDYLAFFPEIKTKTHCCGMGKTLEDFKQNGIEVLCFLNSDAFLRWIDGKLSAKLKKIQANPCN